MKAEFILCASVYVDTGEAEPARRSYSYPKTGLVFSGWRHSDCFTSMGAWVSGLSKEEYARIDAIDPGQLNSGLQGFTTSKGRFVGRGEARVLAHTAGQISGILEPGSELFSEDLY